MSRNVRWSCLAAAVFLVLATGCRSSAKSEGGLLFFPAPPDPPRVQFLTWASGADELEGGRGSFATFVLGEEPKVRQAIQKPYGIAVLDGVVYVCDTKGLSLCRLDFRARTFGVLGTSGPGRLRKPLNVAVDKLGYKFVVDSDRRQVVVFGPDDAYVTAFDVPQPCKPVDLALYENELYVLDNDDSCQIVVLDRQSGKVLRSFGESGGGPGQFKLPNSLAISPDGYLYVSDTHNWRIQKLTREGKPVWSKGQPGYRIGQFGRPRGIRIGPDGVVYVVDGATEIVQMFDAEGQTLLRFGGPGEMPGALGLPSTLAIDSTSIPYFKQYVHEKFNVDYLLFVVSQYGAHLVSVYAFGSFPADFKLEGAKIRSFEPAPIREGIGPVDASDSEDEPKPRTDGADEGG
ncbi:MAG: hypothetical protein AABZ12_09595 [Planctomycetota bacterium]